MNQRCSKQVAMHGIMPRGVLNPNLMLLFAWRLCNGRRLQVGMQRCHSIQEAKKSRERNVVFVLRLVCQLAVSVAVNQPDCTLQSGCETWKRDYQICSKDLAC